MDSSKTEVNPRWPRATTDGPEPRWPIQDRRSQRQRRSGSRRPWRSDVHRGEHPRPRGDRGDPAAPRHVHRRHDPARPAPPGLRGRRQLDRRGDGRLLPAHPRDDPRRRLGLDRRRRPGHPGRTSIAEIGKSTLEVVLTKVHAGGKFDHDTYKVSGGLHGVGVTVVNALSEWLEAEVHRDGQVWRQDYEQGEPQGPGPRHRAGQDDRHQDPLPARRRRSSRAIDFDYDILEKRLRELAFLNKGVAIRLTDERGDEPKRRGVLLVGRPGRVRRLSEPGADGAAPAGGAFRAETRSAPLKSRSRCSTTNRSARWSSRTATTSTRSRGART